MNRTRIAPARLFALVGAMALSAAAQPPRDFSKIEIKTTKISSDFYTLEGAGGTISVLTGPDGTLLVDSQFAPLTGKLTAAIKQISDKPIRFLINTHLHGDHTGGNENFAKLGVTIFSRDQLRWRLAHPSPAPNGTPGTPAPPAALPVVTFDGPVTIHLDGEEVQLIPIRSAHTDGDTLVRFVSHDILATGDFFRSVGYPLVDLNNGGSLHGLIEGLGETIGLAGPNTKIIPGHGPIVDRAAVIAQRDTLLAVRDQVKTLVTEGKTVDEVIAAKPTAEYDARVANSQQTAEPFLKWLYTEVKAGT